MDPIIRDDRLGRWAGTKAWVGYAVAVAGTATAALVRWAIGRWVGDIPPFITFYPVALAAAVIGGTGAGLCATVLSAMAADYFFIPPIGSLSLLTSGDAAGMILFTAINVVISIIGGRLRAAYGQLRLQVAALSSAANAIVVTDRDGVIRWVNPAFERLTGYAAREAVGQNPRVLNSGKHDQAFFKQMWDSIQAGRVWHGEVVNKRKDGNLYTEEMTITPVRDPAGKITHFIAVKQDVTGRKETEARMLGMSQRRAEDLGAMERLHEISTHFALQDDLNSLLGVILDAAIAIIGANKGYIQLLDRETGELAIVVQQGFERTFIEFFSHIRAGTAACGTAMRTKETVIVEDISLSPLFLAEPRALELKLEAGMRAVVCVPLLTRAGQMLGVISAHFAVTHRPSERDLAFLDLLARQAADFIERTQAADALRLSEERFRLLVEGVKDHAIYILDPKGRIATWNGGAERLKGYNAREILGESFERFYPTEDVAAGKPARALTIAAEQGYYSDEGWRIRKDGSRFWAGVTITAMRDGTGQLRGFSKVTRDLTERKLTQEQLERRALETLRQKELLAVTLSSIGDGVIVTDAQARITFLNAEAERLTGWVNRDAAGQPLASVFKVISEESRQPVENRLALRNEKVLSLPDRLLLLSKDGREIPVDDSAAPIRQPDGALYGAVMVFRDVTRSRSAVEALRESERQFRTLADSIPNLAWWANADGYITWYNRRWYEYTGTTTQQMEGWGWQSVHDPQMLPRVLERWKASITTGEPFDMEFPLRGVDGQFRWFLTRGIPLRDGTGKVVRWFGTNTDVSEARAARDILARSKEMLERLVDERTAKLRETIAELEGFSYSIVHDMRGPLRAMQSFGQLAQEACADCARPESMDYFRRIRVASNRMDQLITDALNYSKIMRQELPLAPVDLGDLLRGMVETYPNLHPPMAEIHTQLDGLVVLGNESALTQVFGNLLGNAVKFVAPDVKPRVRVWAEDVRSAESGLRGADPEQQPAQSGTEHLRRLIRPAPPPGAGHPRLGKVRVWVEDNGIGIPAEAHEKIFDMFQRMHGQEEYPGTGIGLTIVRKAMDRMGGRVGVESEPGKGSRFWIELDRTEQKSKAEGTVLLTDR